MKILVTRTDRLGDLVLSLPVLARLKEARPDWDVQVMVAPAAVALVENDPHVSRVWTWQDDLSRPQRLELEADLRATGFDAAVMLQYRRELATVLRRSGIRRRYGPWSKWSSWFLLNRGVWQKRSAGGRHESDLNLDLAERLLADHDTATGGETPVPRLYLAADQRRLTQEFKAEFGTGSAGVIFLHPGSGGSALDWEPRRFAAVANRLAAAGGQRVFVTGSDTDAAVVAEVARHLDPAVVVLAGRYDLREFLAVLAAGDLFIGPSTGPLHLAAALGLPTVGLFPPARTMHPDRWGPRGSNEGHLLNLMPEVICPAGSHCQLERCPHFNCLTGIQVEDVVAAAQDLLRVKRP